jgi:hypothetical protein
MLINYIQILNYLYKFMIKKFIFNIVRQLRNLFRMRCEKVMIIRSINYYGRISVKFEKEKEKANEVFKKKIII